MPSISHPLVPCVQKVLFPPAVPGVEPPAWAGWAGRTRLRRMQKDGCPVLFRSRIGQSQRSLSSACKTWRTARQAEPAGWRTGQGPWSAWESQRPQLVVLAGPLQGSGDLNPPRELHWDRQTDGQMAPLLGAPRCAELCSGLSRSEFSGVQVTYISAHWQHEQKKCYNLDMERNVILLKY